MSKIKQKKAKEKKDVAVQKLAKRAQKLFGSVPWRIWGIIDIAVSAAIFAYWLYMGQNIDIALMRGLGVALVCSPLPLYLSSQIMLALCRRLAMRKGAHFGTLKAIRKLMRVDTLAVNKNGIITMGKPHITDLITEGMTRTTFLAMAASAERDSEHPIGKAIVRAAEEQNLTLSRLAAFHEIPGCGAEAIVNNSPVRVGTLNWLKKEKIKVSASLVTKSDQLATRGKIPVFVSNGQYARGIVALQDDIIPDSIAAVHRLQGHGLKVVMLTTESSRTANAVQKVTLLDGAVGSLSDMDKIREIQLLRAKNAGVAMLGDTQKEPALFVAADMSIHLLPYVPPTAPPLSKRRVETAEMEAKAKETLADIGPPVDPSTIDADLVLAKGLGAMVPALDFALKAGKIEGQNFRLTLMACLLLFVPATGLLTLIGGWAFTPGQDFMAVAIMFLTLTIISVFRIST